MIITNIDSMLKLITDLGNSKDWWKYKETTISINQTNLAYTLCIPDIF